MRNLSSVYVVVKTHRRNWVMAVRYEEIIKKGLKINSKKLLLYCVGQSTYTIKYNKINIQKNEKIWRNFKENTKSGGIYL